MLSTIFLIHFQTRVLLVERQFVVVDGGGSGHGCGGWQRRTAVLLGVSKGQPRNRECTKTANQSCGSGIVRSLPENGFVHRRGTGIWNGLNKTGICATSLV